MPAISQTAITFNLSLILLVNAVFFCRCHYGAHILRGGLIYSGATGQDIATALAAYIDKLAAMFFYLLRRARRNQRSRYVAHDAASVTDFFLGFKDVRLVEVPGYGPFRKISDDIKSFIITSFGEEHRCNAFVDKRHDDDEYGMLLISDVAKKVLAMDRSPDRINVYEIMSKPVLSVDPDMNIRYCARYFERFGLTRAPVIAVPTSTGYGASFGGLAALLAMLNSCAPGVAVVNIDNGFGAATLARRILIREEA